MIGFIVLFVFVSINHLREILQYVSYCTLEGTAAYGRLLLAPAEGWQLVAFGHLEGTLGPLQLQMLGGPFANNFYLGSCCTGCCSSLSFQATEELHHSMDSGEPQLQFGICHFCLSGLLDAQKCEKPSATIKDDFSDPNKPLFCVRDHQIFLAKNLSHIWAYVHAKFQTI